MALSGNYGHDAGVERRELARPSVSFETSEQKCANKSQTNSSCTVYHLITATPLLNVFTLCCQKLLQSKVRLLFPALMMNAQQSTSLVGQSRRSIRAKGDRGVRTIKASQWLGDKDHTGRIFGQKIHQLFPLLSYRRDHPSLNCASTHLSLTANPHESQQNVPILPCFRLQPKALAVLQGCGFSLDPQHHADDPMGLPVWCILNLPPQRSHASSLRSLLIFHRQHFIASRAPTQVTSLLRPHRVGSTVGAPGALADCTSSPSGFETVFASPWTIFLR